MIKANDLQRTTKGTYVYTETGGTDALGRGLYTLNKRILPYLQKKEEVHK